MTDKIILVTQPDDIQEDGLRILLVDLTSEQSQVLSDALRMVQSSVSIIIYSAQNSGIDWILDKKNKSKIIIFILQ